MSNQHELALCTDKYKSMLLQGADLHYHPQALCFRNREHVHIDKNWFMGEYSVPAIITSYCRNTTANGNWCKSKDEIDAFLLDNPSYFVHMKTYV